MAATFNTVFMQGLLNLQFLKFKKPFDFEKKLLHPVAPAIFSAVGNLYLILR